jgi:hypothetical protein
MYSRMWAAAMVAAALFIPLQTAAAADDATLLRVFLTDGTSLISYGEPARVGDRIIFSMPTASTPNPPLHLVDIAADRVDWDRTNRYAASARAAHYVQTQAETDYALLSNEIAQALNDVALTTDAKKRLAIVEDARKRLGEWPQNHYNYRQTEVRQMLALLDEAIADLQAATARSGRFDLSFAAFADPPTIAEPLLPPPTAREAVEQVLTAARIVDNPAERTSLLTTVVARLDRDNAELPADWVETKRAEVEAAIQRENRLDRVYRSLTSRTVALADQRARFADVRGLERLLGTIHERDEALGSQRPDAVKALVTAVEAKLDAARRLRLARDHYALRTPAFREYWLSIRASMEQFAQLKPSLEAIKSLSGSSPASLTFIERTAAGIVALVSPIVPPEELKAAHVLLISAVQLASNAAQIRREASVAEDMTRAWNASSTAAGALMLGAKARSDMLTVLRPPQLR